MDKRERCPECHQKIIKSVTVPGYHWEQAEGYSWGRWVKSTEDKKVYCTVCKKELKVIGNNAGVAEAYTCYNIGGESVGYVCNKCQKEINYVRKENC